jgi:hypothetical protein
MEAVANGMAQGMALFMACACFVLGGYILGWSLYTLGEWCLDSWRQRRGPR